MEKKEKGLNAFSAKLDHLFRVTERGSSVGAEVKAGMGAFCIAVCALLMNTQTIGTYYGNYAGAYLAVSLIAFIGTLLLGVVCNLPVLQIANMGMSAALVSLLGSNTGLTYANVMFVTFLAAVIYLVIVVTPLKKIFIEAIPDGVKKALPVGIGLYVIGTALKNAGLVSAEGSFVSASGLTNLDWFYYVLLFVGIVLVIVYFAAGRKNPLGSTYLILILAMWVGGIVFYQEYFMGGQTATTVVYQRLNLVVATDGANPYNLFTGLSSLQFGKLFSEGLDFSAYTEAGGNVALFIVESVMTFLFLGMYTNLGNCRGALAAADLDDEKWAADGEKKALFIGAVLNVVSPLFGGTPTAIGSQSAVETKDGGKTGLASLIASIGFLIALFSWIFFALFATSTNGVGMWINDTETKLAAYVQDGFAFADLIMVFAGALMLKSVMKVNLKKAEEFVSFIATLVGIVFFQDLVLGVAIGTILYGVLKAISMVREKNFKSFNVQVLVLVVIFAVYAFIALKYGGNYVTVSNNMMMPPMMPPM